MKIDMKKPLVKIISLFIGLSISGIVYFSLWFVFQYLGIIN